MINTTSGMDVDEQETWLSEYFHRVASVSRKRKYGESSSDYFSDSDNDSTDSICKSSRLNESFKRGSSEKLGNDPKFIGFLLQYLSEENLRSASQVARLWKKISVSTLRRRAGNCAFLKLWKSKGEIGSFSVERFVSPLENGQQDIQAVFFVSTSSLESVESEFGTKNFLRYMTSLAGFAATVTITAPNLSFTSKLESNKGDYGVQAICIPKSECISIKGFSIPVWTMNDVGDVVDGDKTAASFMETCKSPVGLLLKGMILLQYQEDPLVTDLVSHRLSSEKVTIPLVGGVLNSIISNEKIPGDTSPIASGWAIYGDEKLRVSSVGLEVNGLSHEDVIYKHIKEHFLGASNGFILLFYKTNGEESTIFTEQIRKHVPGIPIVGIQTIGDLYFQGNTILEGSPNLVCYPVIDKSIYSSIKVTCLLVAY